MDHLLFCYWAQGFFEVAKPETINSVQLQEIKNHLTEVLKPIPSNIPSKLTGIVFNPNVTYCQGDVELKIC